MLNGKRSLDLRQIKLLAKRFNVDPSTFIDEQNFSMKRPKKRPTKRKRLIAGKRLKQIRKSA